MTDDKFILMGLDDEKSGHIAEVLKNKTCKKILNFLAERREASEKDISDGLKIPINTAEYNLKKLIKSGFVDKTKNFFWSVKGKKIPMYKLARKHIIISPSKKPNLNYIKSILPAIVMALVLVALVSLASFDNKDPSGPGDIGPDSGKILRQFSSQQELSDFIKENLEVNNNMAYKTSGGFWDGLGGMFKGGTSDVMMETATAVGDSSGGGAGDYSTTNIQVEGVDEADIVKNDGKYIYVVSGNKIIILEAFPAENMKILSEIKLETSVSDIFINDDKLVAFGGYGGYYGREGGVTSEVLIYDISDKENPVLDKEIKLEGNYVNSRMIGDYVYIISNKYVNYNNPEPPVYYLDGVKEEIKVSDIYYFDYPDTSYVFSSISVIDLDDGEFNSEVYLTGGSSNIYVSQNNIYLTHLKRASFEEYAEEIAEEVYFPLLSNEYDEKIKKVLDSDDALHIKLADMRKIVDEYVKVLDSREIADFSKELADRLEDFEIEVEKESEKTIVHKINIDKKDIEYKAVGEVPGRVLNQFSMDEHKGNFRIATTTGQISRSGGSSLNHLYILDEDLEIIGKVEDLAKGEKIYSARFMGDRAYIVTFKKVDPLFVIDVSDPKDPEVLGYLKITGYSDYLHPYDENHIIGIGKETIASEQGDFAWYQGVKVSLFDVSDVSNPIEKAKIEIGDRGTDSEALRNHKAVLFDKEKNLLVLPIQLYEVDESKYAGEIRNNAYGEFVWQGAFVLDISLDGISERGRISHDEIEIKYGPAEDEPLGRTRIDERGVIWTKVDNIGGGANWQDLSESLQSFVGDKSIDRMPGGMLYNPQYDYNTQIKRSLYMDDVLYTISDKKVKANDLSDLSEISLVEWKTNGNDVLVYY